ncbi:MAG: hypothetical protein JXA46_06690 [Dehalococcoidales bacterium]|nr:hypothetical protein [Dehalococcoidales bacterium]
MKKLILVLAVTALFVISSILTGCSGDGKVGTLQFYANGEDFVRQGFVSRDGWSITFDHVYITLDDIAAYQTDPPYDPHDGGSIKGQVTVSLDKAYTIDLAEGGEDASPIMVGEVKDVSTGHYNAISWKMVKAASGPASGHSLVMIGTAEKDGQVVDFTINIDAECSYEGGEFVGDERKGILEENGIADLEMTFHFDHIFGDADTPADDELNQTALGFAYFIDYADGTTAEIDMGKMHLGHVGEGHCHCVCN